jgi:hypothetical protein
VIESTDQTGKQELSVHVGRHAAKWRLSGSALGVIGVTTAFIALTCWWLTQDRGIPVYDAGYHLGAAIAFHHTLHAGQLLQPFTQASLYPPLAHLIGALAAFVGGVSVASPIIGENIVFVSLLTLGCYQTGRLLFGARAGLLAAIFVLGSPLLIAQFHVFMLDAPETALVAVAMWLLLASEDFSRTRIAGWAGLAVGFGVLIKAQFPFFLAGIVLVALARGGWRNWRGLAAFAGIALVVGAPWYLDHLSQFDEIAHLAEANLAGAPSGNYPATLSTANLTWYFWSTLNVLLFAPLLLLAFAGAIWMIAAVVSKQIARGPGMELLVGGFLAWLAISLTPHHDLRYDMSLLPYLAVIGTGWIIYLRRTARLAAIGILAFAVGANTLATTFGVGGKAEIKLVSSPATNSQAFPDRVVVYSNAGFLVAGPRRDGDVPGLLRALRRDGVRVVTFSNPENAGGGPPNFSTSGLEALSLIARLRPSSATALVRMGPKVVALIHRSVAPSAQSPCTRLTDGTGVWVVRIDSMSRSLSLYCPFPTPHFSSMSAVTQSWLGTL